MSVTELHMTLATRSHSKNMTDNAMPSSDDLHDRDETDTKPDTGTAGSNSKTVLLVDDDIEIVEAVRYALEGAGHTVVVARDGNQGLALAERENPDLIVLDMMMPKRSGLLVLEGMREMEQYIPAIMVTGNDGNRHRHYAEILGVDAYLTKPIRVELLVRTVKRVLEETEANQA